MAYEWTREQQDQAKKECSMGAHLDRDESWSVLAEIERAWGEIEQQAADLSDLNATMGKAFDALAMRNDDGSVKREPIADAAARVAGERNQARARLAHAHDSASALYYVVGSVVDDYDKSEDTPAIARLRAAIDPALSAAALAETQRRDELDEQIRALTTDRDEWRRVSEEQAAMLLTRGPALTPEQAREAVEAILYVPGRSPFAMAGPLVKLLMRVAAPETAEQASMRRAFEVAEHDQPRTGHTVMVAHPAMVMVAEAIRAEQARALQTPPPEMATTTGEPGTWSDADRAEYCLTDSGDGYLCTRGPGHGGEHVAEMTAGIVVKRWAVSS